MKKNPHNKKTVNKTKRWGDGRVAFLSCANEVAADLLNGWSCTAAYDKYKPRLGGVQYAQFTRYVRRLLEPIKSLDDKPQDYSDTIRGYVYFIQAGSAVKIGFSTDVNKRLHNLQTASPQKLKLICSVPGDMILERNLHARFKASQLSGEWFKLTSEVSQIIDWLNEGVGY